MKMKVRHGLARLCQQPLLGLKALIDAEDQRQRKMIDQLGARA